MQWSQPFERAYGDLRFFSAWNVRGQVEIHPLWRRFCQGPRGLICNVNNTDENKNEYAEEELVFVAKRAATQWFIIDARASNRRILRPSSGPFLTGKGLCHVEFREAPQDTQNWYLGSADIKNAFHRDLHLGRSLQARDCVM